MRILRIELTEEDLKGKYTDPWDCPLYRAIKRVEPSLSIISVTHAKFHAIFNNGEIQVQFPPHIQEISDEICDGELSLTNGETKKFEWAIAELD